MRNIILLSILIAYSHATNYTVNTSTNSNLTQNPSIGYACGAVPSFNLYLNSAYFGTINKSYSYYTAVQFYAYDNTSGVMTSSGSTSASSISGNGTQNLQNNNAFGFNATSTPFVLSFPANSYYEPVVQSRTEALTAFSSSDTFRFEYAISVQQNAIIVSSASTANTTINSSSCLTINMTNPCVYLVPTTNIQITLPSTTSPAITPLSGFNATTCNVTLNNQTPPSARTCSVNGDVLTISGLISSYYSASSLSLVVCNVLRNNPGTNKMKVAFINSNYTSPSNIYASGPFSY